MAYQVSTEYDRQRGVNPERVFHVAITASTVSALLHFITAVRSKATAMWEILPTPVMMALNAFVLQLEKLDAIETRHGS